LSYAGGVPNPRDPLSDEPDASSHPTLRLGTSPVAAALKESVGPPESSERPSRSGEFLGEHAGSDPEVQTHAIARLPVDGRPRGAYEVWTQNRVYHLDSNLNCIRVAEQASGAADTRHPLLGSKLVGGRRTTPDGNELCTPLPERGCEAVFQLRDSRGRLRLSSTSIVTRVVLRRYRISIGSRDEAATWGKITSAGHGRW
jgi:hypothetical protein